MKKKVYGTNVPKGVSRIVYKQEQTGFYKCSDPACRAFMIEHYHKVKRES